MILYNVTTKIDPSLANEWLNWIRDVHIPDMKSTGCFFDALIFRLLEIAEDDGITFAVQYHALTMPDYEKYIRDYSGSLRKKSIDKWGNNIVSFRSVLELVH